VRHRNQEGKTMAAETTKLRGGGLVHESIFSSNAPPSIESSRSQLLRSGHPKLRNPVQQVARGQHLISLSHGIASPKPRPDDSFVAVESVLGSGLAVLSFLASPLCAANLSDSSDMSVSRSKNRIPRYDSAASGRDHHIGTPFAGRLVNFASVVRAVGCETVDLPLGLAQ
jgi:hypothetical protein